LFAWTLWRYRPNLQSVALPVPEIIPIAVLGWVANPQFWGREGHKGVGMVPFERALVSSYSSFIVTYLSLRVSEILPFLCCSTPLFRTPPLVSPKFPHVPLGVGGWPLGYEERKCLANCRAISLQDFQLMWSWSTNVTQKQGDMQTELTDDICYLNSQHHALQ